MEKGQIVFSKCGRDKDKAFIVMSVEGEYAFLADGRLRPLNKPKKKKHKHIRPTNTIIGLEDVAISGGLKDADIRKWLLPFGKKGKEEECSCLRTM